MTWTALSLSLAIGASAPVPPPVPDRQEAGVAWGGYWAPGETPEPEPGDGEDLLIASYVVIPLGILSAASGAAMTYLTAPGHCPQRLAALGRGIHPRHCRGLYVFHAIQAGYGALMMTTGFALLGIGLHRRAKHRRWSQRRFRGVSLVPADQGAHMTVQIRF